MKDEHDLDARGGDRLFGGNEVLERSEVGMACEGRYGGVVRNLGCRRLEHGYRPEWVLVVLVGGGAAWTLYVCVLCRKGINSVA